MPVMRSIEITNWLIEYDTQHEKFKLTVWIQHGKKTKDLDIRNYGDLSPQTQDIILDMLRYHKPVYWVPTDEKDPENGIIRVETAEVGKFMSIR